ncbi:hypothetical protein F5888DRAFT_1636314 [Russula emetica]|nr:hypothetical protein F5888DRAFT_1636314 [Russula emetica]
MATATSFLHHPKVMLSYSYIICTSSLHHFYIISTSFLSMVHKTVLKLTKMGTSIEMLKYSLKKEHLNFMNGWSILEAAMMWLWSGLVRFFQKFCEPRTGP